MPVTRESKTRKWIAPAVVIVLIIVLSTSVVLLRKHSPYKIGGPFAGDPEILLSLNNVEIVGRSEGRKAWSLRAERADVARGRFRTTFHRITDGKLFDDGELVGTVKAGEAVYDSSTGNVEVTGGVHVETLSGYSASAQKALWLGYFSRLTCPGRVEFAAGDSKLVGENLVADLKSDYVTLENGKMTVDMSDVQALIGEE